MLNKLFKEKTDNVFLQFFRYIFVGGTSFVVDFSLFFFFSDFCGIYYLISGVLSYVLSIFVNYLLSTYWVFDQNKVENKILEFNLVMVISIIGLGFTEILLWLFTDICGIYYLLSKMIAAAIVLFWNFTARRVLFYGKDFR